MTLLVDIFNEKETQAIEKQGFKNLKALFQSVKSKIHDIPAETKKMVLQADIEWQQELYTIVDDGQIVSHIESFFKKKDLDVHVIQDIERLQTENFFPLFLYDTVYFFQTSTPWKKLSREDQLMLSLFMGSMRDWATFYQTKNDNQELYFWKDIFSHLSDPIALFNEQDELLIYNSHFINLNLLSDYCGQLAHQQIVEIKGNYYRVYKKDLENNLTLIVFIKGQESELQDSSFAMNTKELGIITSSLAHEINNPIAGILAALSYLKLDASEEELEDINEMHTTAERCKELIEVFLGFSRYIPIKHLGRENLENSLNHALSLLRFRLIENNMSLNLHYQKNEAYQHSFHTPIFTMVLYLLLGETLTAYHHYLLISEDNQIRTVVAEAIEREDSLEIILEIPFSLEKKVEVKGLIEFMMNFLQVKLEIENTCFRLIHL